MQITDTLVLLRREEYERLRAAIDVSSPLSRADSVPTGIRRAQEAYWRDLPKVLKLRSSKRRWVAYYADKRLGFGRTMAELYQACTRLGIPTSEVYVDRLEPRDLPPWEEEMIGVP